MYQLLLIVSLEVLSVTLQEVKGKHLIHAAFTGRQSGCPFLANFNSATNQLFHDLFTISRFSMCHKQFQLEKMLTCAHQLDQICSGDIVAPERRKESLLSYLDLFQIHANLSRLLQKLTCFHRFSLPPPLCTQPSLLFFYSTSSLSPSLHSSTRHTQPTKFSIFFIVEKDRITQMFFKHFFFKLILLL